MHLCTINILTMFFNFIYYKQRKYMTKLKRIFKKVYCSKYVFVKEIYYRFIQPRN